MDSRMPRDLVRWAMAFVLVSLAALVVVPILVEQRVEAARARLSEVASPARSLVARLQFALSREMSSLRGLLITGQETYLGVYRGARESEIQIYEELEPLAVQLGPEVLALFAETQARSARWHAHADVDAIARLRRAGPGSVAGISTGQNLFEQTLQVSARLDSAIVRVADRSRDEIRRVERVGLGISLLLALLALASAGAVGWLNVRIRGLAEEAELRRADAEAALAELARANEARARLVRGITHDVKNPLASALGYTELLSLRLKGPLNQAQESWIQGIRRSIDGALAIVSDLLDVARADSGELSVDRVQTDLAALTAEVVQDHAAAAELHGLSLAFRRPDGPLHVHTDPIRVRQVIGNLLSNAVKYTPAPGGIRVEVEALGEGSGLRPGAWAAVRVRDTGPGIPEHRREAIFDEFTRLQDRIDAEGHGLGLAISRRVARLLGGDISVDGAEGSGSIFTLWLPLRAGATPEDEGPRPG